MSVYKTENIGTVLAGNSYGGRGIVIGKSGDGKNAVIAYFIMGRSENSRNRVFIERGDEVVINAYDPSKLADPTLIIYSPVKVSGCHTIVTNGDETDTIYDFITEGKSFEEALETRQFEPDAPNLTPRISGMLTVARRDFKYKLSILKSGTEDGAVCNRYTFSYAPVAELLAAFEADKFRPQPDVSRTADYFSSDLLILDDLGTEMTTQFAVSALYQLLNSRLLENRPTIVSTNLPLGDIAPRYSAQIYSRLLGAYRLYKFYGDDIRFKLK